MLAASTRSKRRNVQRGQKIPPLSNSKKNAVASKAPEKEDKISSTLKQIYTTLDNPAAFGSVRNLYLQAKKRHPDITLNLVKKWLTRSKTYTRHRRVYIHFPRRKVIVRGIDRQWQADLIDLQTLNPHNRGFKYILVAIDVFSRKAWVEPMKTKHAQTTVRAFNEILSRSDGRKPEKLQTDDGKEFVGSTFKRFLRENDIIWFSTNMLMKAQIAERFNRTLKNMIHRSMTDRGELKYVDHLQDIVSVYNSRSHRGLKGLSPNKVTLRNEAVVYKLQYGAYLKEKAKFLGKPTKFVKGDTVRLSKYRNRFSRGFRENYTSEIFKILSVQDTHPVTYTIQATSDGEAVEGAFYGRELVPAG